MGLLIGRFDKCIDLKHRINLPLTWKDALEKDGSQLVLARWFDNSLALFPESVYAALGARIMQRGSARKGHRMARYIFSGQACNVSLDAQGRLTLPQAMVQAILLPGVEENELVLYGDWDKVLIFGKATAEYIAREHAGLYDTFLAEVIDGEEPGADPAGEEDVP